jgi:endonuclease/exonuclease/phosphatase family metal-dependent hydrolase
MPSIRLATFNVENMFTRFDFDPGRRLETNSLLEIEDRRERDAAARIQRVLLDDDQRIASALTLRAAGADVLCLQEVEGHKALKAFNERYLRRVGLRPYPHLLILEGNDRRGIDVALMSRFPIVHVRSHTALRYADLGLPKPRYTESERVFQRDCLEATLDVSGTPFTVFVCHFKSMGLPGEDDGRAKTRPIREAEAAGVKRAIEGLFGDPSRAAWAICGDLNDYTETDGAPDAGHALRPLLEGLGAIDLAKQIADARQRWTHYFPRERSYHQLDYLLISPALAAGVSQIEILRGGQPYRAERYSGPRYPRIGWDSPKASDHAALAATLSL